jgi:hypothetical protein
LAFEGVCSYGVVLILLLTIGDGTVLLQLPCLNFCIVTILDGDNEYGFCRYG